MAKKKISFDIETKDFERLKIIINKHHIAQSDFLRMATIEAMNNYQDGIISVYVVENDMLVYKTIDIGEYKIEIDNSFLTKQLTDDFEFITSGFLFKDSRKIRFYSKYYIEGSVSYS